MLKIPMLKPNTVTFCRGNIFLYTRRVVRSVG